MAAVALIGAVRLLSLGAYPVMDNTESRYAEIARVMAVGGDWITPRLTDGRPFWAKPPLTTWLTAGCLKIFGVNEFAARLPYFLLAALVVWLTFALAKKVATLSVAWLAAAILSTCALMFVAAGAVMTDLAMAVGTTLSMVGYWLRADRRWALAAFAGAGIALLGKGPVGVVLIVLPILAHLIWTRDSKPLRQLPWLAGLLLAVGIAAPWYALAEYKTPGFLRYFLIGEHVMRFVDPGWKGDLYGTAHVQPKGMIWLYFLGSAFPWSFVALYQIVRQRERLREALAQPLVRYLLCWALTPLIFFTLAGNILYTYVLPGLPAFAILLALGLPELKASRGVLALSGAGALVVAALLFAAATGRIPLPSERDLVRAAAPSPESPLLYWRGVPSSASFYGGGGVKSATDPAQLYGGGIRGVVVDRKAPPELEKALAAGFAPPQRFGKKLFYRKR